MLLRTDIRQPHQITLSAGQSTGSGADLDEALRRPPDAGFFGRDDVLLAIDLALDRHSVVLLHAFSGSGKTATAAEFARWYSLTGGVQGPVLFTTFEHHIPLARVLDRIGDKFAANLERSGILWLSLDASRHARWPSMCSVKRLCYGFGIMSSPWPAFRGGPSQPGASKSNKS